MGKATASDMKCDECKQNEASVHLSEGELDQVRLEHLCIACAEKREFHGLPLLSDGEPPGWFFASGHVVRLESGRVTLAVHHSSDFPQGFELAVHSRFVPEANQSIGSEFSFSCPANAKAFVLAI